MFTNEFEADATITTIMDETGEKEDVHLIIDDEGVWIRQFPENQKAPADLIMLSHKMFKDMIEALQQTEGFFVTKYKAD